MISIQKILALAAICAVCTGCFSTQRQNKAINYLQYALDSVTKARYTDLKIKVGDPISVQVLSATLSQEQVAVFNLPQTGNISAVGGTASTAVAGNSLNINGYWVDSLGNIQMPVIGVVPVAGKTRAQVAEVIQAKIQAYVKDPIVLVKFIRLKISVLGEVKQPGIKELPNERATLLDALAMSGDLTDFGERTNVLLIRENDGKRETFRFNLLSGEIFSSPAYQLQQNDVIVVSASENKLKALSMNPNFQRDLGTTLAIVSVLVFLANTLILLIR